MSAIRIAKIVGKADNFPTFLARFAKGAGRNAATREAISFPYRT